MRASSSLGNIRLLGLFNFFNDFKLFGPILIIYFTEVSGSYLLGGSLFAVIMISSALFEIPTGLLSDRMPRTRVTLLGGVATAFAFAVYASAPSYEILVAGAVLEGLGRSLFSGNNTALLWDSLAEHGREGEFHHHSGRVNAGFQIALASSAMIGGLLAGGSMRWVVAASVVPQLMSVVVAALMKEPAVHRDVEPEHPMKQMVVATRRVFRDRRLRTLTLANALVHGAGESGWQFQPAFVAGLWPSWAVGLGRGANHATSIVGFWFAGRVIDRFGPTRTLLASSLVADIIGFIAYGKPTVVSPAITPIEGALYGSSTTSQDLMLQRLFTDGERATMGSIGGFLGSIAFGAFSMSAGAIADAWGVQAAMLFCHIGAAMGTPVYWWIHHRWGNEM